MAELKNRQQEAEKVENNAYKEALHQNELQYEIIKKIDAVRKSYKAFRNGSLSHDYGQIQARNKFETK